MQPANPRPFRVAAAVAFLLIAMAGCGRSSRESESAAPALDAPAGAAPAEPSADSAVPRIVCLGDSLTAGLGVPPGDAYPALLQQKLRAAGYRYEVVNAGVSGDTSAGGLRRLDWSLRGDVRVLVLALGANDGLRGLPAADLEQNLSTIVERARTRHVRVLLAGMEAPPNFGADYTRSFRAAYAGVAAEYRLPFIPFFLVDVAGRPALNQADGIHPNPAGHRLIADRIWRELQPLVAADTARR